MSENGRGLVIAENVVPQMLPMLWRERIPAATLSVIAGKPGLGKSSLTAMMAAELSQEGLSTIVSNVEDDVQTVTRPRLDVAGADLTKVHLLQGGLALPAELDYLEGLIRETRAVAVVLDPVAAHFTPESGVHKRPVLHGLIALARSTRCAIVAVHHMTKNGEFGGPNGGLLGSSRAAYVYGFDPEDRDRRALACEKCNGFEQPAALILEQETVEYRAHGALLEAGRLKIAREGDVDSDEVVRRGLDTRERDAACAKWLSEFLASGEDCKRQTAEIRAGVAGEGFPWETVRRAGVRLRVEKLRIGWGGDGFWVWRLPDAHPLRVAKEPAA